MRVPVEEATNAKGSNVLEARGRTNGDYAGKKFPMEEKVAEYSSKNPAKASAYNEILRKYPNGVVFDKAGFPDFSPYSIKTVKIRMKGNRTTDFTEANKVAGLKKTPEGYTWHHNQDRMTMQLVPRDLHDFVRHDGGFQKLKN